jgi:RND family efflux transporter MFP subunit
LESRDQWVQNYTGGVAGLEAAASAQKSAEAAVKSARAAIHVAESAMHAAQSQRDQYKATRSFRNVTASFDGFITKRNVDAGALITAGSNTNNGILFDVAKTDILRIFVNVPEQYVPDIEVGQQAICSFQSFPGKDFVGRVSNIAGGLEADSKTLQVEIMLDNAQHKLLPGMFAQVMFHAPSQNRVAVVPASCVQTRTTGAFIYTVDSTNHVHQRVIEIGRDLGGRVEIARGLTQGDKVIVSPSEDVVDDKLVSPLLAKTEQRAE